MSIPDSDIYEVYGEYLFGRQLEVGLRFRDLSTPIVIQRIDYLRRSCVGKKVLRFGCLDHPKITRVKVKKGT